VGRLLTVSCTFAKSERYLATKESQQDIAFIVVVF
jgi:hypothetical protein